MNEQVVVVGIGADGWDGVVPAGRRALLAAAVVLGSPRQLDLLPEDVTGRRRAWGSPLRDSIAPLLAEADGPVVALASGDPLVSGLATTMIDVLGSDAVRVIPAVSSVSLARAAMRWSAESTVVVRDHREVARHLHVGARILVLSADATTPAVVGGILVGLGFGASVMTVLGDLGSAQESRRDGVADSWSGESPQLHVLAVDVAGEGVALGHVAGLPDEVFEHDGQLTKRDVRAAGLARLAPRPGEHLWDVGAGAGSVGIEWARAHRACSVSAIERDPDRAARIRRNAERLGAPAVTVVEGGAPEALVDLPVPDAIFIGGGATREGVVEACWSALRPGGRLVVHGVTLETDAVLTAWHGDLGGELVRISVETVDAIGAFRGWKPARAVTQWSIAKPGVAGSTP